MHLQDPFWQPAGEERVLSTIGEFVGFAERPSGVRPHLRATDGHDVLRHHT